MPDETTQINTEPPELAGGPNCLLPPEMGQGADSLGAELAALDDRPEGFQDVSRSFLMRLVKRAANPKDPITIPRTLLEWGIVRLGEQIASGRSSARTIQGAIRRLEGLQRLALDQRIHEDGGPKLEVTHRIAPQTIQDGIDAYVRANGGTLPGGYSPGVSTPFARLVGGGRDGGEQESIPAAPARNGHRSNGSGPYPGANGNGHSDS